MQTQVPEIPFKREKSGTLYVEMIYPPQKTTALRNLTNKNVTSKKHFGPKNLKKLKGHVGTRVSYKKIYDVILIKKSVLFFYRQFDFPSEPGVGNEILENGPKSCLTVAWFIVDLYTL